MIGLVIATHGSLADELVRACEIILGPQRQVRAVGLRQEESMEEIRADVARATDEVGRDGDGVVIMTDMFGGTPANIALAFLEPDRVEVLTGVNLPMVLKFCSSREGLTLPDLARMLKTYGQQSISLASEFLQK